MYSISKSFVGIAVGFLEQDGLIKLSDKIIDYFDEEITKNACKNVKNQTIKNMLMMSTGFPATSAWWFGKKVSDRLKDYFDSSAQGGISRVPGTTFEYDSAGSFVLGALVENITGKPLMDYLREKLFDKIGVSNEAYCLKCPGGHSWGDSGVLCTARDLAKMILFAMNMGEWNGEQILSKEYLKAATSNLIDSNGGSFSPCSYGYGYQIWRTRDNSFFFNGMGAQYAIAVPDKDIVFVINSDNQGLGSVASQSVIINTFFEEIVNNSVDAPLGEDKKAHDGLIDYSRGLKLFSLKDSIETECQNKISGKVFKMNPNPMGITEIKLIFEGNTNILQYKNEQGDKKLYFSLNKNTFGLFPQEGYSDLTGGMYAPGNYYKCAASAKWTHENSLSILVQIIDKYFGRLYIRISFPNDNTITVNMDKVAEAFLEEYIGYADGEA